MDKNAKYCPKCGTEQPEEVKTEEDAIEVEFIPDENIENSTEENNDENEEKKDE